jgi:multidrug efflux pump
MDPLKMASYGITPMDVLSKIQTENVELPSGRIEGQTIELSVRTKSRLSSPQEFNELIIKESESNLVRFQDIGTAELSALNEKTLLRHNLEPSVGVVLVPLPNANNIEISNEFYKRLDFIKRDLPADVGVEVAYDSTRYIRQSISEVEETIITAFILVVAIIFLFLRDWRTTFIPVVTIPISLIGVFFIMYLMDFSINVLTLLGIVLSIGLVVDDAIVVLENIYSRIEKGEKPMEAAAKGSEEIFFAVIATTIALAAVFLPVIFLTGTTGRLFREFGIVVAGSVIISAFVALTMTPMLSAKMLKHRSKQNAFYRFTEPFFVQLNLFYGRTLTQFMKVKWISFPIIGVMGLGIYWLFSNLQSELVPIEDRSELTIRVTGPEGATFSFMDQVITDLNADLRKDLPESELKGLMSMTSPSFSAGSNTNSGFFRLYLTNSDQRARSQQQIFSQVNGSLSGITAVRAFAQQPASIGDRRGGLPVQYVIQAPTLEKLKAVIPKFMEKAAQNPAFIFTDINLKFTKPELEIEIDRERARNMGVSVQEIARTLQLSYSGQRFAYFIRGGKQYQVIGEMQLQDRNEPVNLRMLYVRGDNGELIQLDNLVRVVEKSTPPQLYRFNRFVSATVSANLANGVTIGAGLDEMDKIAAEV